MEFRLIEVIETSKVVDAAGGWSQQIAKMVNVELPVYSERHEILVTESVKPILDPMLMSFLTISTVNKPLMVVL